MSDSFPHVCVLAPYAFPLLAGDEAIQLIGGAELQMVIVAKLLAARGRRISMVCLDFGQQDKVEIEGITVIRAYKPDEGVPVLRFVWPRLTSMWACMKRAGADVYYQQTAGMLTGVMAEFCRRHGRKSVFASASNPDLFPNTPRIRFARDRWIYAYGLRHVDRIFVQNDEQAQLCRTNLGREPIVVPNCYELPAGHPAEAKGNYVLWVSTIRSLKRPELFLDIAHAFPNQQFRMIGGPDNSERDLYARIKERADAMENVEFLGFVPFARIEEHFDEAKLFVNTSESEGVPNAFLQAWARGVPTVSFIDAGAKVDGLSIGFQVNTLEEMIGVIDDLESDPSKRGLEGKRCAEYVAKVHSSESVIPLYEQLFAELAESEGAPRR
jgi:glycosyltransferase involved in cell wall biosynthesis